MKIAQEEKIVDFPRELDLPWKYLQRHFGIGSHGGNVTTNFFCNFDSNGNLIYRINSGMSEKIRRAEYEFARIFVTMEGQVSMEVESPKLSGSNGVFLGASYLLQNGAFYRGV